MKISESLFAVSIGKADPIRVKQLSDRLFAAYEKAAEQDRESVVPTGGVAVSQSRDSSSGPTKD